VGAKKGPVVDGDLEYGKTDAEKIGRTVKIKKHTKKKKKKKQYREMLKQIQRKSKQKIKQRKQNIGKPKKT
jgi:hypothetical protein